MYGYIEGFSDVKDIHFCPKCGTKITETYDGQSSGPDGQTVQDAGTAYCSACGFPFGVIEVLRNEKGE